MYRSVKSRVKYENVLSENSGVRQGECLSPFLFSMYVNDIEEHFSVNGFEWVDLGFY